jgi:hypothetical protein
MFGLSRKPPVIRTVRQDWHAELSEEKLEVFEYVVGQVNPAYVIYSVALDEAIELRKSGRFALAREQATVSADLCDRFAGALEGLLQALARHAEYFGTLPSVNPLDSSLFVSKTARKAAFMNSLLSRVLFQQNNRFLHKLWTLEGMASDIGIKYRNVATQVDDETSASLRKDWELLSCLQFDLTTSLREFTIMLKSYLVSLPGADVASFLDRLVESLATACTIAERRAVVFLRE